MQVKVLIVRRGHRRETAETLEIKDFADFRGRRGNDWLEVSLDGGKSWLKAQKVREGDWPQPPRTPDFEKRLAALEGLLGAGIERAVDERLGAVRQEFLQVAAARVAEFQTAKEALREQAKALELADEERTEFVAKYSKAAVVELRRQLVELQQSLSAGIAREAELAGRIGKLELEKAKLQLGEDRVRLEVIEERQTRLDQREERVREREILEERLHALELEIAPLRERRAELERLRGQELDAAKLLAKVAFLEQALEPTRQELEREQQKCQWLRESNDALKKQRNDECETVSRQAEDLRRLNRQLETVAQAEASLQEEKKRWLERGVELETILEQQKATFLADIELLQRTTREEAARLEALRLDLVEVARTQAEAEIQAELQAARGSMARVGVLEHSVTELELALERALKNQAEFEQMREQLPRLRAERDEMLTERDGLMQDLERLRVLHAAEKKDFLAGLEVQRQDLRDAIAREEKRFEELRAERTRDASDEVRLAPVKTPWVDLAERGAIQPVVAASETEWLKDLEARIRSAGFQFPPRLLKAFHTSLKVAQWAPVTALAGVSGTGKSELPRLYASLGGLNFLSVPVQPNWDSPQDLFGFFDYMDGRFRPTELLRALEQARYGKTPGTLADEMVLVLLDEMNRARFELYFSDMLIRLESRRGAESEDMEKERSITVDVGARDRHAIPLGQNLLFVGTMNEDETTHSLSDMVLDRGNVLSFPRPKTLHRRDAVKAIEPRAERLSKQTWSGWTFQPADLPKPQREHVAELLGKANDALAHVNRAIGHRVLQAVEAYVANYPGVLERRGGKVEPDRDIDAAVRDALEDQLVQKLAPKLRGVELGSKLGGKCLDKFEELFKGRFKGATDDFVESRKASSGGSFVWSSSTYLIENEK